MLAIIIPYYKMVYFEKTLKALAAQTDQRFHVYIGDDASPDDPNALLEKFTESFPMTYHRFENNLGGISLTGQWERCLALAGNEEWVTFLGDDDILQDNFVAAFYAHLDNIVEKKCHVVRYASVVIDQHDVPFTKIYTHPELELPSDFLIRRIQGKTRSSMSEYIFSKQAVERIKFKNLPLAWYADVLGVYEFSCGTCIYSINDSVVQFRYSGENISSRTDNHKLKNEGSFAFYYHMLKHHKNDFDVSQRDIILNRLEKTFLDNKRNAYFWSRFTILYWSDLYFKRYFLFLLKVFRSTLK